MADVTTDDILEQMKYNLKLAVEDPDTGVVTFKALNDLAFARKCAESAIRECPILNDEFTIGYLATAKYTIPKKIDTAIYSDGTWNAWKEMYKEALKNYAVDKVDVSSVDGSKDIGVESFEGVVYNEETE
jgi:hypothetical protein